MSPAIDLALHDPGDRHQRFVPLAPVKSRLHLPLSLPFRGRRPGEPLQRSRPPPARPGQAARCRAAPQRREPGAAAGGDVRLREVEQKRFAFSYTPVAVLAC